MRIALDVDGVLADVIQTWLIYNNRIRKSITKNEITEWNFWEKFQINRFDFYRELSTCWKSWKKIPPTEEKLSTIINELSKFGTIDIVTARERSTDEFVKNWLKSQKIIYQNYVSVIDGPKKALLDYDVFIDDSPLNAKKIVDADKKILLYSQPWNLNIDNSSILRIDTLSDAKKYLQQFY